MMPDTSALNTATGYWNWMQVEHPAQWADESNKGITNFWKSLTTTKHQ